MGTGKSCQNDTLLRKFSATIYQISFTKDNNREGSQWLCVS